MCSSDLQVLAHFGIKPKVDARTSIFIGGDDKTLSINPQVNTNFLDGGQPDIKAIGVGDLSHRHMFTAQVGELLPVFTQWVNPNETFRIGYNGKTRTAALNTDAFTRIRENIQYYFVPFQSVWKYFEQQVNNLTKGDAGQNISKFASSSTGASLISTSLPYISYVDLGIWLSYMVEHASDAISQYFTSKPSVSDRSASGFAKFCASSQTNSDIFVCDCYRYCRAAKLLMALGYGNFDTVIQYDVYSMRSEERRVGKECRL